MAHPGGRPPYFTTVEELDNKVDEYFKNTDEKNINITLTGLCLHLGFADKCSFYDYEDKPEFTHSIKRARFRVEQAYENRLCDRGNGGDIFALKNFGWKDRQEVEGVSTVFNITADKENINELKSIIKAARESKNNG